MKIFLNLLIAVAFFHASAFSQNLQWRRSSGSTHFNVRSLDLYAGNPDTLYAGGYTYRPDYQTTEAFFLSTDRGETWDSVFVGPTGFSGIIRIDPQDSHRLYLLVPGLQTSGNDLLRTSDGGASWIGIFGGRGYPTLFLDIDHKDPRFVYTWLGGRLSYSTDRGVSWRADTAVFMGLIFSMAIAPGNDSILYVAGFSGDSCFKSTDRGASWKTLLMPGGSTLFQTAVDRLDPDIVYIATSIGLFKSIDGGTSWREINNGLLPLGRVVSGIVINPRNANEIFLTMGAYNINNKTPGIYRSTDAGEHWNDFSMGLPDSADVNDLVIDTLHNRVYVGISSVKSPGVYILDTQTSVGSNAGPNEASMPGNFQLSQNFPNPFNPRTIVWYDIPKSGYVTLKVYDVLGRVVSTLFDGLRAPGSYHAEWDATFLPSGIYYYRIESDKFTDVKKMMLVR